MPGPEPEKRLLAVDDDPAMRELLSQGLSRRGFEVCAVESARAALDALANADFGAMLTDLRMPEIDGIELCTRAAELRPAMPIVLLTAFGDIDVAVRAIRAGAYDFVTKPCDLEVLALVLDRAFGYRRVQDDLRALREQVGRAQTPGLLGDSRAIQDVRELVERVAETDATVLLTGESGTGKEVVARALHHGGRRAAGPFIAINCAALPEPLLESELFGHVRGAFTDARGARAGLFVRAEGGTVFLDEIGEMPLGMQAKLLRVLEEHKVRPVGGDHEVAFDARVIAATNRDLETAIEEGRFRRDLYFRLNVIEIALPPLRVRGNDVLLLAQHALARAAQASGKQVTGLSAEAAACLLRYDWPGNVRELLNCIERGVTLSRHVELRRRDLPRRVRDHAVAGPILLSGPPGGELLPLEQIERRYIEHVLDVLGGNRTEAARVLGLDRKTLYRKLERWKRGEE